MTSPPRPERVTRPLRPHARHELFHETNRDQVPYDLIGWVAKALP